MNNRGEKLSFYQLFKEKEWKVEIPILQRDYAHGRESAKEIRDDFLDELYKHLINSKNINLDFIYGSVDGANNDILILLDGQQRLTTLFLLHWYLSNKENKNEKLREFMVSEENGLQTSNFTYETRTTSSEFCDSLVNNTINLDCLIDNSVSKTIQDKPWYFESWDKDPTINSMLNMLDDMHSRFKNSNNLFDKLLNKENPPITFQFLNLEEFQLTDDLYIKMNARGKQLTTFENFKAKLEQYIKNEINLSNFNYKPSSERNLKKITADKYFSHKIDTDWTNLFWNYRNTVNKDDSFDEEIMNFIRVVFTNQYIIDNSNINNDDNLELLLDTNVAKKLSDYKKNISFHGYKKMGAINKNSVLHLINAFTYMSENNKSIKSLLKNDYFYYDENDIFEKVLNHNLTNEDRVKYFAYLRFLIKHKTNATGMKEWIRVMHNFIENTLITNANEVARAISSIEQIIDYSDNILNYLIDKNNDISFFYSRQVQEERIKACLIDKSSKWEELIKNTEQNKYYKGQIGFLLEFSGILDYYETHHDCNWTLNEDNKFMSNFKEYSKKSREISSLLDEAKEYDFLWERSVLTKGDYLIKHTANRKNLLSTKRNMRDFSWKRLLRLPPEDSKNNEKEKWLRKRKYVKAVLDDNRFNSNDVESSLQKICYSYNGNDWRLYFIKNPKLISYCRQGYIYFRNENYIYLFKESQRNHYHKELYSYVFYINYLSDKDKLMPFKNIWHNSVKSVNDDSCAVMDDWKLGLNNFALDIRFLSKTNEYEMRIFDRNSNNINEKVINKFNDHGFQSTDKYEDDSYIIKFKDDQKAYSFLVSFCSKIKNIKI